MAANKRMYPRVGNIEDQDTQQSLRLLWDRLYDHTDSLATTNAALTAAQATIKAQAAQIATVAAAAQNASKPIATVTTTPISGGGTGGTTKPPPTDGGQGEQGCAASGSTGHVDPGLPRSPATAGMIVCGVGKEFPALLLAVADQPTRDTNRATLLDRMIWHLNLQGFPASHYGTDPTSSGYKFLLLIQFTDIPGGIGMYQSAYRVTSYDTFAVAMTTTMVFGGTTLGQGVTPDGGLAD